MSLPGVVRLHPGALRPGLGRHRACRAGSAPQIWTFVTYALIHGDFVHLGVNAVWLLAFGSAVARRFGATGDFFVFFAVTAAAGAATHLATHDWRARADGRRVGGDFRLHGGGDPLRVPGRRPARLVARHEAHAYHVPAAPLRVAFPRSAAVLAFLAVWFGMNILFGLGSLSLGGEDQRSPGRPISAGFWPGLLLFPLFDPVGRPRGSTTTAMPQIYGSNRCRTSCISWKFSLFPIDRCFRIPIACANVGLARGHVCVR